MTDLTMKKISVVVPVYKVEQYLDRCVKSILSQTFSDFELILVDDGSPDNCGKMCDEYAEKDGRIKVIHKKNGGLSDARNFGIDYAMTESGSEWITFIDSDDWVHPKYLEALYNAVTETGLPISVCSFERTYGESPAVDETLLLPKCVNTEEFYCKDNVNAIVAWGKLYKKDYFGKIRYPVGKLHEDEFVTYRIIFQTPDIAFIDEPLYAYFQNSGGTMLGGFSERNLVVFDAVSEQISFFNKNGYKRAYASALKSLLGVFEWRYGECEDEELKKELLKKFRRVLFKNRRSDIVSFKSSKYLYDIAYPRLMKYYWAIRSRLKRRK